MAFLSFAEALNFSKKHHRCGRYTRHGLDADTGFGNAVNAMRVTEEFIKIGAAGMNIEDQVFPKRCGHLEGKQINSNGRNGIENKGMHRGQKEIGSRFCR